MADRSNGCNNEDHPSANEHNITVKNVDILLIGQEMKMKMKNPRKVEAQLIQISNIYKRIVIIPSLGLT